MNGEGLGDESFDYVTPPETRPGAPAAVTAEQAIGDLPPIDARALLQSGELRRGARRFDQPMTWDRRRKAPSISADQKLFGIEVLPTALC
jgi:DNA (cytosine-5)-methyltransferase 1